MDSSFDFMNLLLEISETSNKINEIKEIKQKSKAPQSNTKSHKENSNFEEKHFFDLKGKYTSLLKKKKFSLSFQKMINSSFFNSVKTEIFNEVLPDLSELLLNKYSSFSMQKLFFTLGPNERKKFIKFLAKNIVHLSCNSIGKYSIQAIINNLDEKEIQYVLSIYKNKQNEYLILANNEHGVFVLEKILEISFEVKDFTIFDFVINNLISFLDNKISLILTKKIIEINPKENPYQFNKIRNLIVSNIVFILNSNYGNCLVKFIINIWKVSDYKQIIPYILLNFFQLCKGKYTSSTIEMLLEVFPFMEFAYHIICLFQKSKEEFQSKIKLLLYLYNIEILFNQYGKFIILKLHSISNEYFKNQLISMVNISLYELQFNVNLQTDYNNYLYFYTSNLNKHYTETIYNSQPFPNNAYFSTYSYYPLSQGYVFNVKKLKK